MAQPFSEEDLNAILHIIGKGSDGTAFGEIAAHLKTAVHRRTLQGRLNHLVETGRLVRQGKGRGTRYSVPQPSLVSASIPVAGERTAESAIPLSAQSIAIRESLRQPLQARKPCRLQPGVSGFLSTELHLLFNCRRTSGACAGGKPAHRRGGGRHLRKADSPSPAD